MWETGAWKLWRYFALERTKVWRLINGEHDTTEEEPSFDTLSARDDVLLCLPADDDDDTKDVAYNAVAMGFSLEYNRLD
jgi:hypothetical protein